jgi:TonB family protein
MMTLESWVLPYLVNSLWQIPLVFVAAWVAARLVQPIGPKMEHRVWVAAILLQTVLPACRFNLTAMWWNLRSFVLSIWGVSVGGGEAKVAMGPGAAHWTGSWIPKQALAGVVMAYGISLLYFAARLVWGVWRTGLICRQAEEMPLDRTTELRWRQGRSLGSMTVAVSPFISGPVTVGVMQGTLLLPLGFVGHISQDDLDTVLAHEFAHVERRDFAKNLFYSIASLPVTYHPLLWLTRSRLAESREMICDSLAADAVAGRERYARSLLRLASMLSTRTPARALHAIGMFDANIFERRVMNLTQRQIEISGARRLMIAAVCGVVALGACASALALHVDVAPPAAKDTSHAPLKMRATDLAILYRKMPVYPAEAKANNDTVDGAVVLHLIIGTDGAPQNIQVTQSLRRDYDLSALEAVSEWRWQPYLLNGNPVAVDTNVTITYSIGK